MRARPNRTLVQFRPGTHARLRLLCFPYAGGSAAVYRAWALAVPPHIDLCAVQYPGRGHRLAEHPLDRMSTLIEALAEDLRPVLRQPFAFFGHSLGGVVAFELARLLRKETHPSPARLIASGRRAPHISSSRHGQLHDLPERELIEELEALNGTPKEVLEHPEMMEIVLPFLRADLAIDETYVFSEDAALDCPISAYGGEEDRFVHEDEILAWGRHTRAAFRARTFPGDHFFIHSAGIPVLRAILEDLGNANHQT